MPPKPYIYVWIGLNFEVFILHCYIGWTSCWTKCTSIIWAVTDVRRYHTWCTISSSDCSQGNICCWSMQIKFTCTCQCFLDCICTARLWWRSTAITSKYCFILYENEIFIQYHNETVVYLLIELSRLLLLDITFLHVTFLGKDICPG